MGGVTLESCSGAYVDFEVHSKHPVVHQATLRLLNNPVHPSQSDAEAYYRDNSPRQDGAQAQSFSDTWLSFGPSQQHGQRKRRSWHVHHFGVGLAPVGVDDNYRLGGETRRS